MHISARTLLGGTAAAVVAALLAVAPAQAAVTITSPGSPINDTTPTFTGTANTGSGTSSTVAVDIYAGTTVSGSPVQSPTGSRSFSTGAWSITASTLAAGTYTARARQGTTRSSSVTFTIDTTPPAVTVTTPAASSRTRDNTPSLGGAAGNATGDSSTVTVRVYAGSTATGTPVQTLSPTRSGAGWSTTAAILADGTYTIQATQTDSAGNTGTSAATNFVVDTAAPATAITSPVGGSRTGDNTPSLSGTAGNATGDSATVTVRVYAGSTATGTPVQTLSPTRSGTGWSTTAATLADGTYTAQATQADDVGNSASSAAVTFVVDTAAPAVAIASPTGGSRTGDNTPSLAGTAGNATGDSATVTVKIYAGSTATGTPVQTLSPARSGTGWSTTAATLADGTYTAQATQADDVGHSASSSAVTFVVDTGAPAVTVTTPAAGSRTRDNTPSLGGAAGNATGDSATVTVKIYAGSTATGTPVQTLPLTRSAATWSGTAATLADGTYTVQATQADDVGNSHSDARTFVVDTTAPGVSLAAPVNGSRTADTTPTLSGGAGNATGDDATVTASVYSGAAATGTPVQTLPITRSGANWSGAADTLPDGTYTVQATQADDLGNSSTSAAHTFVVDTGGPDLTIERPSDGGSTNDTTPPVSGRAGDSPGDGAAVSVEVFTGPAATGTPVQSFSVNRSGASWGGGLAPLAEGTYTLQVTQRDDLDHSTVLTSTFTVDVTAPTVTLTGPADGSSSTDTAPTFSGTASEASAVTVRVRSEASVVRTLTATPSAGGWSVKAAPALAPGTYVVDASQSDGAGNSATSTPRTFTVTSPPATAPLKPSSTPPTTTKETPRLLSPFPIVRFVGRYTRTGARFSLVTVRAPAGSDVEVRCKGRSCPFKRRHTHVSGKTSRGRTVTVKDLAGRSLLGGVVLEVRVTAKGRVGKYTRFRVRRGRAPLRLDTCVMADDPDPVRCPS